MNGRLRDLTTVAALVGLLGATEVAAQSASKPAASTPAGQAAKSPEPIKDTKRFAEHTGLFRSSAVDGMGIGDRLYAVPWNAVILDRDKRTVHVDVRKETLERAPSFPPDRWPDPTIGNGGVRFARAGATRRSPLP
jgi:hypothetical protein